MPNRKAKDRKRKKRLLNKKLAAEGRTAVQHKKWLTKQEEKGIQTPGFVMSLFAMYKNYSFYKDDIIRDSISGNLCRCTGYRPIRR